jgi:hypothetical protein
VFRIVSREFYFERISTAERMDIEVVVMVTIGTHGFPYTPHLIIPTPASFVYNVKNRVDVPRRMPVPID